MKQEDVKYIIEKFNDSNKYTERYSSFDYCYNYFHPSKRHLIGDKEKSCLVLGFYLASWGMLRGSSVLLSKSIKHYEKVVDYILSCHESCWGIDVSNYDEKNINRIIEIYEDIRVNLIEKQETTHKTLVTKVLLGVFGFIPAFDNNFITTFKKITNNQCGFSVVNPNSLNYIKEFYKANEEVINKIASETYTKDFTTEKETKLKYPKAKIIDMYGFQKYLLNQ